MATTKSGSWAQWAAVGAALVVGAAAIWWTASGMWETQPPALPPEKFMEAFKAADAVDRENWERMWRDAGKKAPPPPAPRH